MNCIANQLLHQLSLFSRMVVYFIRPVGAQSMSMPYLFPANTRLGWLQGRDHLQLDERIIRQDCPGHLMERLLPDRS
jgi:hypothetical protein